MNCGCSRLRRSHTLLSVLLEDNSRFVNACSKVIVSVSAVYIEQFHILRLMIAMNNTRVITGVVNY